MPSRIAAPVVTIDAGKMHKIDTGNVENLFSMWTVFSKCAESMEEGRRLENLGWRIWSRETFCCDTQPQFPSPPSPKSSQRTHLKKKDIPELSSSIESACSDVSDCSSCESGSPCSHSDSKTLQSSMSTSVATLGRGKEKQLSSAKLEKMVVSIKEQKRIEPLPESIANAVPSTIPSLESDQPTPPPSTTIRSARSSSDSSSDSSNLSGSPESGHNPAENAGSDTSAELLTSHSVVRGFSPGNTSSFRSYTHLAPTPILKSSLQKSSMASKAETKKGGVFFLGASSGEDESSFEEKMASLQPSANRSSRLGPSKKQTSFKAEVESRQAQQRSHENENVFESDEDEEDEEEDESDWEDSASEGDSALDEKPLFQRIPSRPELTSRRSLLTTMIQEPDRAKAFAEMASKSTPALQRSRTSSRNGPSLAASPEEGSIMHEQFQGKGSRPIIMTTSNLHPPSLSPRTTRRNMMSHELTESLRKGLLWERLQKNTTVHAVLRRRHTSQDIAKLKQYPKPIAEDSGSTSKNNSWNNFQDNGLGEYHERGW